MPDAKPAKPIARPLPQRAAQAPAQQRGGVRVPEAPSGPQPTGPLDPERIAKVVELMRPAIQADGGDIEFVDVNSEGVVRVRLHGACVGCPSSEITLQLGIEKNVKAHCAGVTAVKTVD